VIGCQSQRDQSQRQTGQSRLIMHLDSVRIWGQPLLLNHYY